MKNLNLKKQAKDLKRDIHSFSFKNPDSLENSLSICHGLKVNARLVCNLKGQWLCVSDSEDKLFSLAFFDSKETKKIFQDNKEDESGFFCKCSISPEIEKSISEIEKEFRKEVIEDFEKFKRELKAIYE